MSKNILSATLVGCLAVTFGACRSENRAPVRTEEPRAVSPGTPMPTNTAPNTTATDDKAAKGDGDAAKVLAALHQDNQNEIAVGKMAEKQGLSKHTKQLGAMLIKDHTAADQKVMAYVRQHNVVLDSGDAAKVTEDKVKEGKDVSEKLSGLKGADFDKEFASAMEKDHKKAIDTVSDARKDVKETQLQTLLAEIQPTLEKHLEHAKMIENDQTAAKEGTTTRAQGRRPTR